MTYKPYQLAHLVTSEDRPRVVQIISYPFPSQTGDGRNQPLDTIKIRLVPGDPTTITEVPLSALTACLQYRYIHFAEVAHGFAFPADMLRYDDAFFVSRTSNGQPRQIYCVRNYKRDPWTHGRWSSFSANCKPLTTWDLRDRK